MPFMPMAHDTDPRQEIYSKIGFNKKNEIPGFRLKRNDVLVGIYQRPEKTKSGIFISDKTRDEDKHQGKAALVLLLGPSAFVSDDTVQFTEDQKVKPGDWIALWVSDGRQITINGQLCRVVRDQDIVMEIPSPDAIF